MFCEQCGASLSDGARFCPSCGARQASAAPARQFCPACGAEAGTGDVFCAQCGSPLSGAAPAAAPAAPAANGYAQPGYGYSQPGSGYSQPGTGYSQPGSGYYQPGTGYSQPGSGYSQPGTGYSQPGNRYSQPGVGYAQPGAASAPAGGPVQVVAGSVPKRITGRRVIPTNRSFSHDELLRFLSERWDTSEYNRLVTDPALSRYTARYVVLPATARYMIIVYSEKKNQVVLSYIPSPAGAGEMMMRAIPTHNAFFGAAKLANTLSVRAEREGPLEDILQRYADYLYALLRQAGYAF